MTGGKREVIAAPPRPTKMTFPCLAKLRIVSFACSFRVHAVGCKPSRVSSVSGSGNFASTGVNCSNTQSARSRFWILKRHCRLARIHNVTKSIPSSGTTCVRSWTTPGLFCADRFPKFLARRGHFEARRRFKAAGRDPDQLANDET